MAQMVLTFFLIWTKYFIIFNIVAQIVLKIMLRLNDVPVYYVLVFKLA